MTNLTFLAEISTLFLNYRSMYTKQELNEPMGQFVSIMFFITYTIFRMVNWPFIIYLLIKTVSMNWVVFSVYEKFWSWFLIILFGSLYILNIYWYALILKGLFKLIANLQGKDK